jgi:trehalose utilization protein
VPVQDCCTLCLPDTHVEGNEKGFGRVDLDHGQAHTVGKSLRGEVFRSGATWKRGNGKIFYFRPGHETYPIYYEDIVLRVIANGIKWAAPMDITMKPVGDFQHPKEKLDVQLPEWARKDS